MLISADEKLDKEKSSLLSSLYPASCNISEKETITLLKTKGISKEF
jgi:hypothetical protein